MDNQKVQKTPEPKINKFLFSEDFSIDIHADDKPTISKNALEQERDSAHQSGYDQGFNAGRQEAQSAIDAQNTSHLENIAQQLDQLHVLHENHTHKTHENVAHILDVLTKKLLPVHVETHGTDEVVALVAKAMQEMKLEPHLIIHVAPHYVESVQEKIERLKNEMNFAGRLTISPSDSLHSTDCYIEWKGGGLERVTSDIFKNMEEAIARMSPTPYEDPKIEEHTPPLNTLEQTNEQTEPCHENSTEKTSLTPEEINNDHE